VGQNRRGLDHLLPARHVLAPELALEDLVRRLETRRDFRLGRRQNGEVREAVHHAVLHGVDQQAVTTQALAHSVDHAWRMNLGLVARQRPRNVRAVERPEAGSGRIEAHLVGCDINAHCVFPPWVRGVL
jgi:hypothetical protein